MYTGVELRNFGQQVRKIVAGEGVPKCLIFYVDSLFWVEILSENFSHYTDPGGTWNILLLSRNGEISVFTKFEANLLEIHAADLCQIFTLCRGSYLPSTSEDASKPEV